MYVSLIEYIGNLQARHLSPGLLHRLEILGNLLVETAKTLGRGEMVEIFPGHSSLTNAPLST